MTSTLTQLQQRTDADAEAACTSYTRLLTKSASGKPLTKLEGDSLHAACKDLDITPEQAAEDEVTLKRIAELTEIGQGWDGRLEELDAERKAIGSRWSRNAEVEARLKLIKDFGEGRERLAKLDRAHVALAKEKLELKTLQQDTRLFAQGD